MPARLGDTSFRKALPSPWCSSSGLPAGKSPSSMTKGIAGFWSLSTFPKLVVIVLSLYLLLSFVF